MLICLVYALVALIVALIFLALVEWGVSLIGVSLPANILMLFRALIVILWLLYVLGCFLPFAASGSLSWYPYHPHP